MKIVFIIIITLLALVMAGCIYYVPKKENIYSKAIIMMLTMAILTTISYIAKTVTTDYTRCSIYYAFYYLGIDWMLIGVLNYACVFDKWDSNSEKKYKFRNGCVVLVLIDSASLLISAFMGHMFCLVEGNRNFSLWNVKHTELFWIHMLICYGIVFGILYQFICKLIITEKIFRRKYHMIFVIFLILVLLNGMFLFFSWDIDYSTAFYAIFAVVVCYYTYVVLPGELIDISLQASVEKINCGIMCFDREYKCIYANSYAMFIFGVADGKLTKIEEYAKQYRKEFEKSGLEFCVQMEKFEFEDGEHTIEVKAYSLTDKRNRFIGHYLKMEDMTEEIKLAENEKYRATHDILTGVYNRQTFIEKSQEILRNDPDTQRYLVCTNIKDFKLINDLFGERFGNEIIKKQAEMLKRADYADCVHGRMGGDRFAMLIKKSDFNIDLASRNTKSIREEVTDVRYKIHMYIGVYEIENPYENITAMCDKAMLAIKSVYGDYEHIVGFYDTDHMERLVFEQEIVSEFNKAIDEHEFKVYVQPKFDVNNKLVGIEVLSRWQHPLKGMMYPTQYIPVLERTGYILNLDTFMIESVVKHISQWSQKGINIPVTFNLSAKDFYYINIPEFMKSIVSEYDVLPSLIGFEITEDALEYDTNMHMEVLNQLREHGFRVFIDDFGMGYSSLNLLKDLEVDGLKIDMEFFEAETDKNRSMIIIKNIVDMAKKLGLRVVAERVETAEQMDIVKNLKMDVYQGYKLSPPVNLDEFEEKYIWRDSL